MSEKAHSIVKTEDIMSRAQQRENRRKKDREIRSGNLMPTKEEKLDLIDYCGIKDPTPYEAVNNIIRKERAAIRSKAVQPATA